MNEQASSMPTFSTFPERLCFRSLMNVLVIAETDDIFPLSQMAVSMQWARRSLVSPLPAAATSSRHSPVPACGWYGLNDGSCNTLTRYVNIDLRFPTSINL